MAKFYEIIWLRIIQADSDSVIQLESDYNRLNKQVEGWKCDSDSKQKKRSHRSLDIRMRILLDTKMINKPRNKFFFQNTGHHQTFLLLSNLSLNMFLRKNNNNNNKQ